MVGGELCVSLALALSCGVVACVLWCAVVCTRCRESCTGYWSWVLVVSGVVRVGGVGHLSLSCVSVTSPRG